MSDRPPVASTSEQADEAHRHGTAPRSAVFEGPDITLSAVPLERGARKSERAMFFSHDDLHVDGRVGRKRQRRVRDLADHLADLAPAHIADPGRDGNDPAVPPPVGQAVERDDHPLAGRHARQVRLVDARPHAQVLRVRDARDELPGGDGLAGLSGRP